jgi:hypothetical protein
MSAAVASATAITTERQPCSEIFASAGRNTRLPVAVLAVRTPITRPRLVTNQRLTMVAASTKATQPLPNPESTPHVATSCHGSVMNRLRQAESDSSDSAMASVRRTPKLCIRAAANGPMRP